MPTVLITGASAGIGRDFAREFAARRYDLILVARRREALEQLAQELKEQFGVRSHVITADLASPTAPITVQNEVQSANLSVDVLVNNAGFGAHGAFTKTEIETHLDMLQVNITSLVHLTRTFLPSMMERRSGGVLNVASTAAFVPGPGMAVYYATKAFVLSFTEALANEMQGTNVKVSCLCPGATITEFQVRSGMDRTDVFKNGFVMDSPTVARMGIEGFEKNQTVVICGGRNQLAVAASRFVPRKLTASVIRRLQNFSDR